MSKIECSKSEFIEENNSGIHNRGVFAKKFIPKGTKIIQYVGEKISKEESEKRADNVLNDSKKHKEKGAVYIFELNEKFDLDGNVFYNTARFINHSCLPNCESENIDGEIWILSTKDIKKGEELLYNYGYDIDNFHEHPCFCGADDCVGYIADETQWDKLKKTIKKPYNNKKVLVLFYSRTGNTKKVAKYLSKYLDVDVDEIKTDNRKGFFGFLKSLFESVSRKKPVIEYSKNLKNYDLVILGSPFWVGTLASPTFPVLDELEELKKDFLVFITCQTDKPDTTRLFSSKPKKIKGLTFIHSKKIKQNKYQHELLEFFRNVKL